MALENYVHRVEDWNRRVRELRRQEPEVPVITVNGLEDFRFMLHVNLSFGAVRLFIGNEDLWNSFQDVPFDAFVQFIYGTDLFTEPVKCQILDWFDNIQ